MSIREGIGAVIGALLGCILAAVFNVLVIKSIWFAFLPFFGYIIGGKIGKFVNNQSSK